ncbi:DUF6545 domain-containing protein [Nocardia sp. NPDC052566]|uniref:DUF6545 domain-containing protein n=1 Tax=Nocardia sp. NPDC052566 TaxID=3364330 RepID=UPI0037C66C5D
MNTAPAPLVATCIVLVVIILAGRWWLLNDAINDRLINQALTWDICGLALLGGAVLLGAADLGPRLFLCGGLMALANVYGWTRLLDDGDPGRAAGRQRGYNRVAAMAGLSLLLFTAAEGVGVPLIQWLHWDRIIWDASELWIMVSALRGVRACARELRVRGLGLQERLAYLALLAVTTYWLVSAAVSAVRITRGWRPENPGPIWATAAYINLALIAMLISLPLAAALLTRSGLDRSGRHIRRLRPLWRDLTAAVPEVVLDQRRYGRDASALRLYRMTVEIWDALLHLRPYLAGPHADITGQESDPARLATAIAHAAQEKSRGVTRPPIPQGEARSGMSDQTAALRFLLALADEWPRTRVIAARAAFSAN